MSSRKSKTTWVLSLLVLTGLVLSACGGAAEPPAPAPVEPPAVPEVPAPGVEVPEGYVDTSAYATDPPYTVCFSNASVSNSWRVMMNAHVTYAIEEARAAGLVDTYRYADANDDPAKQISDVEDLLAQGCDVLILSAAAADVVTPAAVAAMEAGVPVVTLDRDVVGMENRVSFVEGDSCIMGRTQAEWLVEELGGEGNIVLLSGAAGASPAEERLRCAREVFAATPGITELAQAYTGWSPTEGQNIMATWLTTFPDIDGVWSDSALQGSGAVEAYRAAGLPVPPITGEDWQRFLRQWADYDLTAMGISFPTRQGYEAVRVALDVLQGIPVMPHVQVAPLVITTDNFASVYNPLIPDEAWVDALPEVVVAVYPEAAQ